MAVGYYVQHYSILIAIYFLLKMQNYPYIYGMGYINCRFYKLCFFFRIQNNFMKTIGRGANFGFTAL